MNKSLLFVCNFKGRPYKYFLKLLERSGFNNDLFDIIQTNDHRIVIDYLEQSSVRIIVGVGKEPTIYLHNSKKSIKMDDIIGHNIAYGNKILRFIYHPSFCMVNNAKYEDIVVNDLRDILVMVKNG